MSALLQRGATKDATCRLGSPLGWAALHGQYAVVETLLAAGADVSLRSTTSYLSPLDNSARYGHVSVLKAILGHGADVNAQDRIGRTAIHHAAMTEKVDAIDALVEAGADIESRGFFEQTILYGAASKHKLSSVRALLKRGASIEARDFRGSTPLHGACETRYPGLEGTVDLLLRWGADETASDKNGRTPAEFLFSTVLGDAQCSEEEVQRTRLLLARAPADRAWRRRCWLVMLRWQDSKAAAAAAAGSCSRGSGGDVSTAAAGGRAGGESCKVKIARTTSTGHSSLGRKNNGGDEDGDVDGDRDWEEADAEIGGGDLRSVVVQLLGLEVEGVFRTVVGFL